MKLEEMYNDDKIRVGMGIQSFKNKVDDKYIGIGTGDVEHFFKRSNQLSNNQARTKDIK